MDEHGERRHLRKGPGAMSPTEVEAELERLHEESFAWALSCCEWDESEAEDVLQTTYLKVVSGKALFGGRSSFRTWLFGVIRRTAQELHRRTRRRRSRVVHLVMDVVPAPDDPARETERAEASRRLADALTRLSDRQREILHLVFYQDLTIAEAAAVMEIGLGSARTHYERGKARLRALLQEARPGERPVA
jgi:RNA polymerase sigma-70 factor (ECF subfamily)